jgi:hypothetical protein
MFQSIAGKPPPWLLFVRLVFWDISEEVLVVIKQTMRELAGGAAGSLALTQTAGQTGSEK